MQSTRAPRRPAISAATNVGTHVVWIAALTVGLSISTVQAHAQTSPTTTTPPASETKKVTKAKKKEKVAPTTKEPAPSISIAPEDLEEAPAKPAEPEAPFVDPDLAAESAPPPKPVEVVTYPRVALLVDFGIFSRSTSDAPGTSIDASALPTIGVEGRIDIAPLLFKRDPHEIFTSVGYARRLAQASGGGADVSVNVDRFHVGLGYLHAIDGRKLPRVGPIAAYEVVRYELGPEAGALSTRYSVFRLGLQAKQALFTAGDFSTEAWLEPAARLTVSGGDLVDVFSFDLGGGLAFALADTPFIGRLGARYVTHSLTIGGRDVDDRSIEVALGIGVSL